MVTWTEGGTSDRGVWARQLTAAGSPTGPVIEVADEAGTQELSRVAVSPDGTFSVVWADPAAADEEQEDIYMARYDDGGDLIDDFAVVARADYQLDPDVAALPDGTLVVAFWDRALGEVRARRFEPDGDLVGTEISVGEDVEGFGGPGSPSVDADAGGFTVAYELDDTTFVRRFGPNGTPVTVSAVPFDEPFAATAPDGRSVVAWTDSDDVAKLREYSTALVPDGGAQSVSATGAAGSPHTRGVAADADGFVVVWEADDADETGVYARRFSVGRRRRARPDAHGEPDRDRGAAADGHPEAARHAQARRADEARRRDPRSSVDEEVRQPPQLPHPRARAARHPDPAGHREGQRQAGGHAQGQARHRPGRPARAAEGALQGRDRRDHVHRKGDQGHAQVPHLREAQEAQDVAARTLTQLCQGCAARWPVMRDGLTIHEAAETTGWSPRMLRYVERVGLVEPARSPAGYRLYGPAELQRLRTLRELLSKHDLGLSDVAFARRLREEAELRRDTEDWLQARPERPDYVSPSDWLTFEQDKHERLLAAVAAAN